MTEDGSTQVMRLLDHGLHQRGGQPAVDLDQVNAIRDLSLHLRARFFFGARFGYPRGT